MIVQCALLKCTKYYSTETVLLIFPISHSPRPTLLFRWGQVEVRESSKGACVLSTSRGKSIWNTSYFLKAAQKQTTVFIIHKLNWRPKKNNWSLQIIIYIISISTDLALQSSIEPAETYVFHILQFSNPRVCVRRCKAPLILRKTVKTLSNTLAM